MRKNETDSPGDRAGPIAGAMFAACMWAILCILVAALYLVAWAANQSR
jgi:hypothetical protein